MYCILIENSIVYYSTCLKHARAYIGLTLPTTNLASTNY